MNASKTTEEIALDVLKLEPILDMGEDSSMTDMEKMVD